MPGRRETRLPAARRPRPLWSASSTGAKVPWRSLGIGGNGATLASSGADGRILVWDVAGLRRTGHFGAGKPGVGSVAVSPDGRTLAYATSNPPAGSTVTVFTLVGAAKANPIDLGTLHTSVTALAFSPDGSRLVAATEGDGLLLWRLPPGGKPTLARRWFSSARERRTLTSVAFVGSAAIAAGDVRGSVHLVQPGRLAFDRDPGRLHGRGPRSRCRRPLVGHSRQSRALAGEALWFELEVRRDSGSSRLVVTRRQPRQHDDRRRHGQWSHRVGGRHSNAREARRNAQRPSRRGERARLRRGWPDARVRRSRRKDHRLGRAGPRAQPDPHSARGIGAGRRLQPGWAAARFCRRRGDDRPLAEPNRPPHARPDHEPFLQPRRCQPRGRNVRPRRGTSRSALGRAKEEAIRDASCGRSRLGRDSELQPGRDGARIGVAAVVSSSGMSITRRSCTGSGRTSMPRFAAPPSARTAACWPRRRAAP